MQSIHQIIDPLASLDAEQQLAARTSLPQRMLRASRAANPVLGSLAALDARLDELDRELEPESLSPRPASVWWDNPEIYAPLVSLGDRCPDVEVATKLLDRLDVIVGRVPVEADHLDDGVYRLAPLGRGVVRRSGGRVAPLDAHWSAPGEGLAYLPVPGLFTDVPFPEVYEPTGPAGDAAFALARYRRARRMLAQVDPVVARDFERTVSMVALMPPVPTVADEPWPLQAHWSFSLRMRLFGSVFINPFSVGVPGLMEGLLHEYLHQRIWLWWELCPPSGLPGWERWMLSPVSGKSRPVITMVHAFVIFAGVVSLHEALLDGLLSCPEERAFSERRSAQLIAALPGLAHTLEGHLPEGSETRELVRSVLADFLARR